ncbi:ANTAR domain-containing response regulator [Gracilibacillus timonensis]|uniref:ANTAR domain-containing response regulator n=1 Tax=Gracilibacillus timonensis TaxID=1816696 RepID=UPI0021CC137A|nr:response regulator [Gracilibacillus timonensis]
MRSIDNKLRTVIAEDELLVMMGLESNLKELGHEVVGKAADGEKAVRLVLNLKPDVVLVDVSMPKMDGIEAIHEINEEMFVPSIIISAYHDESLIKRASEEGVFSYLVKPVDLKDLKAAINITLDRVEEFKDLQEELHDTKKALEARKYIEKAKGILMESKGLKEPEAMQKMQHMSRNQNKKLVEIAKNIIAMESLF